MVLWLQRNKHRLYVVCILWLFFVSRSFPFRTRAIPLGYDPGLYKAMFQAYSTIASFTQIASLPQRIQTMYEPWLGMVVRILSPILTNVTHDTVFTWWRVFVSMLLPLAAYLLWWLQNKKTALFALLLVTLSFTQYQIFWRSYWKQTIGIFLSAVLLWWRSKKYIRQMIPLIAALLVLNRPAALLVLLVAICWSAQQVVIKQYQVLYKSSIALIVATVLVSPLIVALRWPMVASMIQPFFAAFDMPVWWDSFQAWGTFLTTKEYLLLAWYLLPIGLYWRWILRKPSVLQVSVQLPSLILLLRVFWQALFFQRMIGYFDFFLCVTLALLYASERKKWIIHRSIIILLLVIQASIWYYRMMKTYTPLIEKQEFEFIQKISTTIEDNAYIIVPGIQYSARVKGRSAREVLAPWLFDINRWWTLDEQRTTKRLEATSEQKCSAILSDYPALEMLPGYVWIGSKQEPSVLTWWCFRLMHYWTGRSRWKIQR